MRATKNKQTNGVKNGSYDFCGNKEEKDMMKMVKTTNLNQRTFYLRFGVDTHFEYNHGMRSAVAYSCSKT